MMTDPIGDFLTRVRNAHMAKHQQLTVPYSRLKEALVKVMVKTGHLGSYEVKNRELVIKKPVIISVKRLSKPGGRIYVAIKDLSRFNRGRGETILSTSKGLLTAREAYKQKLGGELLCKIV